MKEEQIKKPNKRFKRILIGLGVTSAAVGGYLGWNYFKKNKQVLNDSGDDSPTGYSPSYTPPTSSGGSYTSPKKEERNDDFPLKKGSKGEKVKAYQEYLIKKHGKSILPKYGADGDFGSEMVAALEKLKLPTEISQTAFNLATKGAAPNTENLAKSIYESTMKGNFSAVVTDLKKIRNVNDYKKVSEEFQQYRLDFFGPRKTLVTGLLQKFTAVKEQTALQKEFERMGLKYNGDKWSLSGMERQLIVSTQPTWILDMKNQTRYMVGKGTVLGYFEKSKQGYTLFSSLKNNQKLIVKTNQISFYEKH